MGSCYSCRSGEGSYTYTTVSMATTAENPVAGDTSTLGKRGSPYTRGGSGGGGMTTSFGFKRRIPATLKSLSQERTSEMVQKYECKIANINNATPARSVNNGKLPASNKPNSTNRTPHSNIPRVGLRNSTNSRSSSNSVEDLNTTNALLHNGDPNSNSVIMTDVPAVTSTVTKSAVNGTKGVEGGRGTNQSKRIRETSPDLNSGAPGRILNGHKTEETVVRHSFGRSVPPRHDNNRLTPPRTIAKVTTHVSGLPRPQVPLFTGAKNSAVTTAKENPKASEPVRRATTSNSERTATTDLAPIAKCDEIEAMQISSDTMPEEDAEARLDSGLGGSVSDRVDKNDGDNETLAEVSELASDSTSEGRGGSKERTPERSLTANVHNNSQRPKLLVPPGIGCNRFGGGTTMKQDKPPTNAVVARPKLSQPTSAKQVTVNNYTNRSITRTNDSQRKAADPTTKSNVNNMRKSFPRKVNSNLTNKPNIKTSVPTHKNEEKPSNLAKENKPVPVPPASKAAEVVSDGIRRLSLDIRKTASNNNKLSVRREKTERSKSIDASTQSLKNCDDISAVDQPDDSDSVTLTEKFSKTVSDMATSMESCTSAQDSLHDHGPFSPPSERDQFLIDDEIADQPELIACQQHDMQQRDLQQRLLEQELFDVSEDGGSEGMALLHSCSSLETLSSTSSLDEDDLMLDFEHESSADATRAQRSGDHDALDEDTFNSSRRHSKSHSRTMKLRDAKGGILDEWSNLLESHSSLNVAPSLSSSSSTRSSSSSHHQNQGEPGPVNGHKHSTNGRPRTRRARAASTPDVPTPSLLGASQSDTHLLRPPRQMTTSESDDGVKIDPSSFRSMTQDVTNLKTMLYKLKRVLHESTGRAETLNPFESHLLKNGLFHNLAHNDPPRGVQEETADRSIQPEDIQQENTDLRRQVVFLQQQLEERDKTIRLLQQQMTKHISSPVTPSPAKELCNSATQTEKPRVSLSSMSQSYEESPCGTTVSSNGMEALEDSLERCAKGLGHTSPLVVTDMTRSLSSLPNDSPQPPLPTPACLERLPPPPERSVSAVELSPRSKTNPSSLLKSPRPSVRSANSARPPSAHSRSTDTVPLTASAAGSHLTTGRESSPTGSRSRIAVRVPSFRGATSAGTQRPKMGTGAKTNAPLAKATVSTVSSKR